MTAPLFRQPFTAPLVLALFCILSSCPALAASPAQKAASMTLEEKLGQMCLVAFKGASLSPELTGMIAKRHIGGVIFYSSWGNVENTRQVAALNASIQAEAAKTPKGIGLFVGVDQEGGPVNRLREGVTMLPSQMAVAATGNRDHARTVARILASELAVLGFNMIFSPVADVNVNPANPVIGLRSFGSEPGVVSRLTAAMTEEFTRQQILCTPKHFPGHGDTDTDSHLDLPVSNHDKKTLERVDFPPFAAAIKAGAPAIMTAHVELPAMEPARGVPSTLSAKVLEGVLRREMRFDGLIVTDSLGMGAVAKTPGTARAAVLAAKAGADVLLFGADAGSDPKDQQDALEALGDAVRSGELPMARVDQAVLRILEAKQRFGILEASRIGNRAAEIPYRVGTPENAQAALAVAQAGITVRHDRLRLLPLKKNAKVLAVWPKRTAFDPVESLRLPDGAQLLRVEREPSEQEVSAAVAAASQADVVLAMTYGATSIPAQERMVRSLVAVKPQAVIHVALGSPYDLPLFPEASAQVASYGDVPASVEALSRALAGTAPFTGRLPVRLP